MRNILWNLQLFQCKIFLKTIQSRSFSMKNISTSCKTPTLCSSQKKSGLPFMSLRCLWASSINSDKISQNTSAEVKKNTSIIYYGPLTSQVKGVKVFTCISSMGGILIQPWLLQNIMSGSNLPLGVALFSCVGFFTFITPFLIHLLTKKYVTEIWYNSATDTYTATTLSFFLRRIDINFKINDIKVPSSLPVFSTMIIKERPVFIISESFLEIEHYIKMMRYDKPMNLELDVSDKSRSSGNS